MNLNKFYCITSLTYTRRGILSLKDKCPIIEFSDLGDERGKLVVIEGGAGIPFEIQRVFYIYGSDATVVRGEHANRESEFVLINVAGTSKVRITDGNEEIIVELINQ